MFIYPGSSSEAYLLHIYGLLSLNIHVFFNCIFSNHYMIFMLFGRQFLMNLVSEVYKTHICFVCICFYKAYKMTFLFMEPPLFLMSR